MGRYLWYAEGPTNRTLRDQVREYVETGGAWTGRKERKKSSGGSAHQQDPLKRMRVERSAIMLTKRHFKNLRYNTKSVEADNVGWDLDAVHRETALHLRLEVKGLSGRNVAVEMTPREYQMMRKYKQSYRVCVVTDCLQKRQRVLSVFAYNLAAHAWTDGNDRPLVIQELKSARLRAD